MATILSVEASETALSVKLGPESGTSGATKWPPVLFNTPM